MVTVRLLPNNMRNIIVMYKNGRKRYKLEIRKLEVLVSIQEVTTV